VANRELQALGIRQWLNRLNDEQPPTPLYEAEHPENDCRRYRKECEMCSKHVYTPDEFDAYVGDCHDDTQVRRRRKNGCKPNWAASRSKSTPA
jgi:hypothetical protein